MVIIDMVIIDMVIIVVILNRSFGKWIQISRLSCKGIKTSIHGPKLGSGLAGDD